MLEITLLPGARQAQIIARCAKDLLGGIVIFPEFIFAGVILALIDTSSYRLGNQLGFLNYILEFLWF